MKQIQDLIQYQLLPYFETQIDYFCSSPKFARDLIDLLQWLPNHPENYDKMNQKVCLIEQLVKFSSNSKTPVI